MNKAEIIKDIYKNDRINYLIRIKAPKGMVDDFRQELFMVLLEIPEEKVLNLYFTNGLLPYVSKIILNSSFNGKLINHNYADIPRDVLSEILRIRVNETYKGYDADLIIKKALKIIESKESGNAEDWHEAQIFKKYIEETSLSRVGKYYGIPKQHIHNVVLKVKRQILKEIKNDC